MTQYSHRFRVIPTKMFYVKNRNTAAVLLLLSALLLGCGKSTVSENVAVTRIRNAFDSIMIVTTANSNQVVHSSIQVALDESMKTDAILKELLTKQTYGDSPLLVNTNINAWMSPNTHPQEVAIVSMDRVKKEGRVFNIGIRFDHQIVYFVTFGN